MLQNRCQRDRRHRPRQGEFARKKRDRASADRDGPYSGAGWSSSACPTRRTRPSAREKRRERKGSGMLGPLPIVASGDRPSYSTILNVVLLELGRVYANDALNGRGRAEHGRLGPPLRR